MFLCIAGAAWDVPRTIVSPTVVWLCLAFAAGLYGSRVQAAAALGIIGTGMVLAWLLGGNELGDVFFVLGVAGAMTAAGVAVQIRSEHVVLLADRAAVLEHERDTQAELAAERERARIARELHDVVAHCVNVIVLQAGAERRLVEGSTADALRTIEAIGREALGELRRLLGVVRLEDGDAPLEPQPTLADLPALVARADAAGLPATLRVVGEARTLPPGLELSAYRIVQEALTNALKHAPGASTVVEVQYRPDGLDIQVLNAVGHNAINTSGAGAGIVGMRERAALFGGLLEAGAVSAGGFRVHARLPA